MRQRRILSRFAVIFVILLTLIILFLPMSPSAWGDYPFHDGVLTLRGLSERGDLAQDIYGLRALVRGATPYVPISEASRALDTSWDVPAVSTHPPTAFLLVAPVAWLEWPTAAALWAWLMLVLLGASLWLYGASWRLSLALVPALMLTPVISFGLSQLVIPIVFFSALAYRVRCRPFAAGVCIGLASLGKFTPMLLLIPYVRARQWRALVGAGMVWVVALLIVAALDREAFAAYLDAGRTASLTTIARADNLAPLAWLGRTFGVQGVAAFGGALVLMVWATWRFGRIECRWTWLATAALAVVALPIVWEYSLAPLVVWGVMERE